MTDLRFSFTPPGVDLEIRDGDLYQDPGLGSAVLGSVFSDARRLPGDDLPGDEPEPGILELRGWWAEDPGDVYGSKLWILDRQKITGPMVALMAQWARESLQWMLDEGIAAEVFTEAVREGQERVCLTVKIQRGTDPRWETTWDATLTTDYNVGGVHLRLLTG